MRNDFESLITKARTTNENRDQMERAGGFATPFEAGGAGGLLLTARDAIEAAISTGDWNCAAEGWVFLDDAIKQLVVAQTSMAGA